jgi:hypothetical protein
LALVEEFHARVEHALYWISMRGTPHPEIEDRLRMTLSALGQNMRKPKRTESFEEAIADPVARIAAPKQRIAPMLRKAIFQIEAADYVGSVRTATRLGSVARKTGDPVAVLIADRVAAQAHHFCGNHRIARTYAERVLDHPAKAIPLTYIPVQVDRRVWMRIVLARTNWIEGYADQASAVASKALELASSDSPFAVCQSLALASCPIAFWRGNEDEVAGYVTMLMREASRYRLETWRGYGEWYECALLTFTQSATDIPRGVVTSDRSLPAPPRGLLLDTLQTINPALSSIDEDLSIPTGWCAPEKVRIQAERLLSDSPADGDGRAERLLTRSLQIAQQQSSLAWSLRTAISLGTLLNRQDRKAQASKLLWDVRRRFSEGFATRDLRRATRLLESLG